MSGSSTELDGWQRRPWWRSALMAVSAALLILANGCSSPESVGSDPDRPTFSADVGCHPSMDASFQAWAERGVGASIVDVGGERECVAAYGFADPESGRRNTTDTVYAIGSITKAVTAAAIFDLIDAGVLTLDDTADQHVPGLTGPAAEATLRELLLHTSGVTGEHGFDHVPLSKTEAIDSISELDRAADAGSAFLYMNANYTVLALVIDEVTDEGYRQYVVDEIMHDGSGRPLGGWWDGDPAPVGPRAWGFFADEPAQQRGDAPGPHWAMEGNGLMAMTPLEMAEWIYALFNEEILTPEATEHLLSTSTLLAGEKELPAWAEIGPARFGERIFATAGGGTGIGHEMNVAWMPESGRVLVIAENALDYDVPSFGIEILPALATGTGVPTPPSVPEADPAVIDATVGRYQLDDGSELVVEEEDGGIVVTAFGAEAITALRPLPDRADGTEEHVSSVSGLFAGGANGDDRRWLEYFERMHGPLERAVVEGTHWDGELVSVVRLEFERSTQRAMAWVDALGVAHFSPDGERIAVADFYTFDDDSGGFTVRYPNDRNPAVVVRPSADGPVEGIQIVGPNGATIAARAAEQQG